ncbi:MAG: TetR/AcrR family transcriptional regulator [Oscillospiraceae bacterium]
MFRDERRELCKQRIIETAFAAFLENGIEMTNITSIAQNSKVPERSLYRYFTTKEELVTQTYYWYWGMLSDRIKGALSTTEFEQKNGLAQVDFILRLLADTLFFDPRVMVLAQEVDLFLMKDKSSRYTALHEDDYAVFLVPISASLSRGVADGSIRRDIDIENAYHTASSGLFGIMQELAFQNPDRSLIESDAIEQINTYCLMVGKYLRAE